MPQKIEFVYNVLDSTAESAAVVVRDWIAELSKQSQISPFSVMALAGNQLAKPDQVAIIGQRQLFDCQEIVLAKKGEIIDLSPPWAMPCELRIFIRFSPKRLVFAERLRNTIRTLVEIQAE